MSTVLLTGFALLAFALVGLEVGARTGRVQAASFGQLVDALARRRASRVAALSGWLWLGWHLFVR